MVVLAVLVVSRKVLKPDVRDNDESRTDINHSYF